CPRSLSVSVTHRVLHSFPTRRSSDLRWCACNAADRAAWPSRVSAACSAWSPPAPTAAAEAPSFATIAPVAAAPAVSFASASSRRSEEHTSELQSRGHLGCRLLLEKKN